MTRRKYIQIDGELREVGVDFVQERPIEAAFFVPDLPEFQSPIDGRVYNGRAGLREHCKIHDVVPTADLKGLPIKQAVTPWVHTKQERAQMKEFIAHQLDKQRNG